MTRIRILVASVVVLAAILAAVSPAMVYYSRYYIQETLLVCLTFLVLAAGWRYVRTRKIGWIMLAGAGLGLMHGTKETCVIPAAALLGAAGLSVLWTRWADQHASRVAAHVRLWSLVTGGAAACLVSTSLFSVFFTNPSGPWNSVRTFGTYLQRAEGSIHEHPWYYYLGMLLYSHSGRAPVWTEGLIVVLAGVGFIAALRRRTTGEYSGLPRFVAFYTLLMTAIYSAIPYKTPWCMLGFLHGMILLAGVGATALLGWLKSGYARIPIGVLLLCATVHLAWQARQLTTRFELSQSNPYVYAHPVADVVRLGAYVERLADAAPAGRRVPVQVIADNCWPLPWYLRRLEQLGYPPTVLEQPAADIVIVSQELRAELEASLRDDYRADAYGLRPDQVVFVYVKRALRLEYERQVQQHAGTTATLP